MWEINSFHDSITQQSTHALLPIYSTVKNQNRLRVYHQNKQLLLEKSLPKVDFCSWHPKLELIVFSSGNTIHWLSLQSESIQELQVNEERVVGLFWKDEFLLTALDNGSVDIWTFKENWQHVSSLMLSEPLLSVHSLIDNDQIYLATLTSLFSCSLSGKTRLEYTFKSSEYNLISMNASLAVVVYQDASIQPLIIEKNLKIKSESCVKFAISKNTIIGCTRFNSNTLVISAGSKLILWNFQEQESRRIQTDSTLTRISFDENQNLLVAVSQDSQVTLYKPDADCNLTLLFSFKSSSEPKGIEFSKAGHLAYCYTANGLYVLSEHRLKALESFGNYLIQTSSTSLLLQESDKIKPVNTRNEIISGFSIGKNTFAVQLAGSCLIFKQQQLLKTFETSANQIIVTNTDNLIHVFSDRIDLTSSENAVLYQQLVQKQDGIISQVVLEDNVLLVQTDLNTLLIFQISLNQLDLVQKIEDFQKKNVKIHQLSVNSNASLVSVLSSIEQKSTLSVFSLKESQSLNLDLNCNRVVWNKQDDRLMHCSNESSVKSYFVTFENGILLHDEFPISRDLQLVTADVPDFYFVDSIQSKVVKMRSPYFKDLPDALDKRMIKQLNSFGFNVAIGNIDEALLSIHRIKAKSLYRILLLSCIKSRKMDMALVCLSQLGYIHAVQAIRNIPSEKIDLRAAVAAEFLDESGLVIEILTQAQLFNELNEYYQRKSNWQKAISVAENEDRIHYSSTWFQLGTWLNQIGDELGAVSAFEKTLERSQFQIPLMMLKSATGAQELSRYIEKCENKNVLKWCAQYMESIGNDQVSLQIYEKLADNAAIVRIFLKTDRVEEAKEICTEEQDSDLCYYHLATYSENRGRLLDAIQYYEKAKAFKKAAKLAQEQGLDNIIVRLALQSDSKTMAEAARYFTDRNPEHAIQLFFKAGKLQKALELARKSNDYVSLASILMEMNESADIQAVKECVEHLISIGKASEAMQLCIKCRLASNAIEIAKHYDIQITEQVADEISNLDDSVLENLADVCLIQRSFNLASKKYIQAGNRSKALTALMKEGDVEKVIFFANVSGQKQKEIYVQAANYLQTCDWQSDSSVLRAIIQFYSKASAYQSLGRFYELCSQIEVEEYQNYSKATEALKQALKIYRKVPGDYCQLEDRLELIQKSSEIQEQSTKMTWSIQEFCSKCEDLLLKDSNGDLYAFYIHGLVSKGMDAKEVFERMQSQGFNPLQYLDEEIYAELNGNDQDIGTLI